MSILAALTRVFGGAAATANGSSLRYREQVIARTEPIELPAADLYRLLRLFALNNGLYEELARSNVVLGRATAQIKAIRNPVPAALDFWAAKLWPDPLVVVSENEAIIAPIEQVWQWSNWSSRRRTAARWCALYGEYFIKVQADQQKGRVWFELLEPMYVTDFEEDPRGYLTFVRLDIPKVDDTREVRRVWTHTETWSSDEQAYRRWETDGDASGRRIRDLGTPAEEAALSVFGIDFVPFVRTPFSDVGEKRGIGAVQLAIEAIVEADISATNLHAMLYQDAEGAWVLKSVGVDANGRPLPPPSVGSATADGSSGRQSDNTIQVGKRSFWRLGGNQELQSVVPDIDYPGALTILQDHDEQLERLIPALSYTRISELSGADLSGRAIRYKLSGVVDQVLGVRTTALEKLAQADMMALTLGQANRIPGFEQGIGTFEGGELAHEFEVHEVIPLGENEQAETETLLAQAFGQWTTAGLPMAEALRRAGYTEEEATRLVDMATAEAEAAMERQQALMPPDDDDGGGEDA